MARFFHSLRFRLLLLVLFSVLPALGLILYGGFEQRRLAADSTKEEALRVARLVSSNNDALVEGAHQLVVGIAQVPQVRNATSDCNLFMRNLAAQYPNYTGILAAGLDGNVYCSSFQLTAPLNISDRDYFQRAIQTRSFIVGDYSIGKVTGKSVLPFAYPIMGEDGQVKGVVALPLDMAWLNNLAVDINLPQNSSMLLVDKEGVILSRYPDPEKWVGKKAAEAPIIQEIIAQQQESTVEAKGVDGVNRLFAFTPLANKGAGVSFVAVGIPTEIANQQANLALARNLFLMGIVILLSMGAAWFASDLFVLRQVSQLLSATHKVAAGDFNTRSGINSSTAEIKELSEGFNHMAQELQEREKAITIYTQRLERSNRDLQDFAYISSHDLQEPLRKIQAFGELLKKRTAGIDAESQGYINRMQSAASRMQTMINDLLAYSRVTTKAMPFEMVDLSKIAENVVSDLDIRLNETGGRVMMEKLPMIEAEPVQMHQLFLNLIGNSLKFHGQNVQPIIWIRCKVLKATDFPDLVQITVEDNGIGFEEKYLDRIFQPFQRLHSKEEYEGSGIGLAICRKIAERHGGSITATSVPGQGSTFMITLPVRQPKKEISKP